MNDSTIATTSSYTDALLDRLTHLFSAIADPTRARLLLSLRAGDMRSGDLAQALGMTHSAVSHQLRWLREHKVVARRKVGREVFYSLADACIEELIDVALRHIQEQLPEENTI